MIGSRAEQYSETGLAHERKVVTMAIKANEIDAVIFTGDASLNPANEYRASDDPEQPKAYLLDPQIPQGATPICAWYTPLESVDGLTGFATISIELLTGVNTSTGVGMWLGLVRRQTDDKRMKIRIYALYDDNVPPVLSQETTEASTAKAAQ
jgi:hypothetical protein